MKKIIEVVKYKKKLFDLLSDLVKNIKSKRAGYVFINMGQGHVKQIKKLLREA